MADSYGFQLNMKRAAYLDSLKAFSITFVILWHVQIRIGDEFYLLKATFSYFYFMISLIGVPTFIFVSLILLYDKLKLDNNYFFGRIKRLFELFIFWISVQTFVYFLIEKELPQINIHLFFTGGPALPIVGGSVFYYLFDLLILYLLSYFFFIISNKAKVVATYIIISLSIVYFLIIYSTGQLLPGYLGGFFIFIPLAYYKENLTKLIPYRFHLLLLYIILGFLDLYMHEFLGIEIPSPYERFSIISGTLTFYLYTYSLNFKPNKIISVIAIYSLGIFSIHKYFQFIIFFIYNNSGHQFTVETIPFLPSIFILFVTVILTIVSIFILSKTFLKRYIR